MLYYIKASYPLSQERLMQVILYHTQNLLGRAQYLLRTPLASPEARCCYPSRFEEENFVLMEVYNYYDTLCLTHYKDGNKNGWFRKIKR